ncbi:MAG TPA: hypothetical protein V6D12_04180 [Candidatus Obscuribacterales bacterium]
MNQTEQQTELQVQKGIRRAEDDLVLWIQAALDNTQSYGDLQEAQFRNLVRVADTTDSPEVIKNFLLYQVGRDKKWGKGKDSLADKIIQDINVKLKPKAQEIAKDSKSSDVQGIWLELIRRYLGYGARYLKYLNSL